jgi:hypothetical protein
MQSNAALKIDGEPTRGPHDYREHPSPESIKIYAGMASPNGTLMIVADGKQVFYTINRKQLFALASEAFAGLSKMEPGK